VVLLLKVAGDEWLNCLPTPPHEDFVKAGGAACSCGGVQGASQIISERGPGIKSHKRSQPWASEPRPALTRVKHSGIIPHCAGTRFVRAS
jgi:hypothetical protein